MNKTFRKLWKGFWEPVLGLAVFQWIIAVLMAICIWFVFLTSFKKVEGREILKKCKNTPTVFVFWHGRSMMLSPFVLIWGLPGWAVSSRHKDGRMMAKLQRMFRLKPIYGSSSEGGVSVLREGVRILRKDKNKVICISPDGPSGPSLRFQDGALYFAKMSGAQIVPVCYSASNAMFQNRWDRYLVALPFSRITCKIGDPIFVDPKTTKEEFEKIRRKIEGVMVKQVRELDAKYNHKSVEQDLMSGEFKQKLRDERAAKKAAKKKKK